MNLREQLAAKIAAAKAALEAGQLEEGRRLSGEAESLKSAIDELARLEAITLPATTSRVTLPGSGNTTPVTESTAQDEITKAVNLMRFGAMDAPDDLVMREIYGGDYRQISHDQLKAFNLYMRRGVAAPVLSRQLWDLDSVKSMLQTGLGVSEIKSTMVEAQDILGGFAVPPQLANQTLEKLPGVTAVRGGGAMIVTTSSNMIQWLKITGGTGAYPSALSGGWGGELKAPGETNFTYGLMQIPVHIYTFKVPMSVSLLEDADNIFQIFVRMTAATLAIDEDAAFLTGDGANKPHGILPGGLNAHSFPHAPSGHATQITYGGLRATRRAVASQYRSNSSWIGTSDTAGAIEGLVDGDGDSYFEYVEVGQPLLRSTWRESESMPAIGAGNVPLIFGDLSGYAIVERLGLAIQRYNDSSTGINKVEFQVRRRLGGAVIEPWKFAVMVVEAS